MTREELDEALILHRMWLNDENGGIKAVLRYANLKDADLEGANLRGIDLYYANLRGANLKDADLEGANIRGANLNGTDLECTKNLYIFTAYDTSKRSVYCVRHDNTFMCKAGCFWGTLDELETKVKETHNSKVYLMNIEIMRELLKDKE